MRAQEYVQEAIGAVQVFDQKSTGCCECQQRGAEHPPPELAGGLCSPAKGCEDRHQENAGRNGFRREVSRYFPAPEHPFVGGVVDTAGLAQQEVYRFGGPILTHFPCGGNVATALQQRFDDIPVGEGHFFSCFGIMPDAQRLGIPEILGVALGEPRRQGSLIAVDIEEVRRRSLGGFAHRYLLARQ